MQFSVEDTILIVSILLIVGVLTAKFSSQIGMPSLVFFIAVGMGIGHFIYFDNAKVAQLIGIAALIVILFEGGLQTKRQHIRSVLRPALLLSTVGVLVTTVLVGVAAKYILGLGWLEGMLVGAIVGSTDAAAVFAALGSQNIKTPLRSTLEAESGTNDPMAVFLTVSLLEIIKEQSADILQLVLTFCWEMGVGAIMGILIGRLGSWTINKINLDSSGLYPVLSLGVAFLTYGAASLAHASGLLAVYLMAVTVGNTDLTYKHTIIRFNEGFAWMMQIVMFILLGLLVFSSQLLGIIWQALGLSLILMIIARPIGVYASLLFSKFGFKEQTFIAWAGLKGAVPIVLATYPLMEKVPHNQLIFNVVFFVVLTSALIQGVTISPLARRLGFSMGPKIEEPNGLELLSLGKTPNEIMQFSLDEDSAIIGKKIRELELPEDVLVLAVIRDENLITPEETTAFQINDILYVMSPKRDREKFKKLLLRKLEEHGASEERKKIMKKI
ncbi:potassium/proton antiporter [Metabacillus sp. GX 13764]|uniref:potassium/proton antiporter n=1 Tax=Metabacillus kandeliae TaxID=2900151 RepID=UPI001E30AF81|nr:potassium/proton antiporter [Metabacillus kandeliae]MCD7035080.1 potassium/proton antiporter [Metabacillus kandeliae]